MLRRPIFRRPSSAAVRAASRAVVATGVLVGVVPLTASAGHAALTTAAPRPAIRPMTSAAAPPISRAPEVSRYRRPALPPGADDPAVIRLGAATDIPPRALFAYQSAAALQHRRDRGCHLRWEFLAAFGRMETDHGRLNGSTIGPDGIARPAILGPVLDGSKPGVIGRLADASGAAVRAAGPLQFVPETWKRWGVGNAQDIDNAAWAAARYLCADGHDLSTPAGRRAAALAYNNVGWYATDVLAVYADYLARRPAHSFPVKPGAGAPAPGVSRTAVVVSSSASAAAGSSPAGSVAPSTTPPAPRRSATPPPTTPQPTPTHTTSSPPPSKSPVPSGTTSP